MLGGAATILYGMIGMLGVRIWVQNKVDFSDPVNLNTAAIAMVVAIANFTWHWGDMVFEGIALGSFGAIVLYHVMRSIARLRGTSLEAASPASAPAGTEIDEDALIREHNYGWWRRKHNRQESAVEQVLASEPPLS